MRKYAHSLIAVLAFCLIATNAGVIILLGTGPQDATATTGPLYTVSNPSVGQFVTTKYDGTVTYSGTSARNAIMDAIQKTYLAGGGDAYVDTGFYPITVDLIYLKALVRLYGNYNQTIVDFSAIPNKATFVMYPGSSLERMKIQGNNTLDNTISLKQVLSTTSDNKIEWVLLSHLYYGVNVGLRTTINHLGCEYIQDKLDWAACIHGNENTRDSTVANFTAIHSSRGVEMDAGVYNVNVTHGYLQDVRWFKPWNSYSMLLDAHSHDGEGGLDYVRYSYITAVDSVGPTVLIAATHIPPPQNPADRPRHISFDHITLINPLTPWVLNGYDVNVTDSRIICTCLDYDFEYRTGSERINVINTTMTH